MIYVEPGRYASEYHKHYYEKECVYVLSGKGTIRIEYDVYPFEKGDFVGLPKNMAAHNIANDDDETLACLVMGQRME